MGCLNSKTDNVITVQQKGGKQRPQVQGFDSGSELSVDLNHQANSNVIRAASLDQPQDESNIGVQILGNVESRANDANNSDMLHN